MKPLTKHRPPLSSLHWAFIERSIATTLLARVTWSRDDCDASSQEKGATRCFLVLVVRCAFSIHVIVAILTWNTKCERVDLPRNDEAGHARAIVRSLAKYLKSADVNIQDSIVRAISERLCWIGSESRATVWKNFSRGVFVCCFTCMGKQLLKWLFFRDKRRLLTHSRSWKRSFLHFDCLSIVLRYFEACS